MNHGRSLMRASGLSPWLAAIILGFSITFARADSVADFYRGKTVTIEVGYGAGGGYDLVARLVAQFLGKHIPGNPKVVVENEPGGGGIKVANEIYNTVAKDGLTLGVFSSDVAIDPLYGEPQARYQTAKFAWVGSMDTDVQSCAVWKGAGIGIKSLSDLVAAKRTITFGSTSPTAPTSAYPIFFRKALGAPAKVIDGYTGTNSVELAMRQGEIDATCGLFESTIRGSYMHDLQSGDLNIFVQITEGEKMPLFGEATPIMDAIKSDEMREVAKLVFDPSLLTRPLAAPPGTPADRLAALRAALLATAKDEEAVAAAKKLIGTPLRPKSGEEVEKMIASFEATPPDLVKKAYAYSHD
jgi:tripartite-type tricarboxylate transporter receptor subunit TctC